jgi:hypothetical protein
MDGGEVSADEDDPTHQTLIWLIAKLSDECVAGYEQRKHLQARCTELIEEVRALKRRLGDSQ